MSQTAARMAKAEEPDGSDRTLLELIDAERFETGVLGFGGES